MPYHHTSEAIPVKINGSIMRALKELKEYAESKGFTIYECDLRDFGNTGIQPLHTESGVIRLYVDHVRCGKKLFFKIHRNPSDVYFIDEYVIK